MSLVLTPYAGSPDLTDHGVGVGYDRLAATEQVARLDALPGS